MNSEIYCRVVPLPKGVSSLCRKSPDGSYTVLISENEPSSSWEKHYNHELRHITNGDFDSDDDINTIEERNHMSDKGINK